MIIQSSLRTLWFLYCTVMNSRTPKLPFITSDHQETTSFRNISAWLIYAPLFLYVGQMAMFLLALILSLGWNAGQVGHYVVALGNFGFYAMMLMILTLVVENLNGIVFLFGAQSYFMKRLTSRILYTVFGLLLLYLSTVWNDQSGKTNYAIAGVIILVLIWILPFIYYATEALLFSHVVKGMGGDDLAKLVRSVPLGSWRSLFHSMIDVFNFINKQPQEISPKSQTFLISLLASLMWMESGGGGGSDGIHGEDEAVNGEAILLNVLKKINKSTKKESDGDMNIWSRLKDFSLQLEDSFGMFDTFFRMIENGLILVVACLCITHPAESSIVSSNVFLYQTMNFRSNAFIFPCLTALLVLLTIWLLATFFLCNPVFGCFSFKKEKLAELMKKQEDRDVSGITGRTGAMAKRRTKTRSSSSSSTKKYRPKHVDEE